MSKPKSPAPPQALQTIDPSALANVSGGRAPTRSGSGSSSGGGSGGGGDDALVTALSGILDSLSSLASQPQRSFGAQEMMLLMMMMQRNGGAVQVAPQPALPIIYTNGTNRIF
jgi:hypothetical protein